MSMRTLLLVPLFFLLCSCSNEYVIQEETADHVIDVQYTVPPESWTWHVVHEEVQVQIAWFKDMIAGAPPPEGVEWKNGFNITSEIIEGKRTKTVVLTCSYYTGAAHPNTYSISLPFDTVSEEELLLSDLFSSPDYLNLLAEQVREDLMQKEFADEEWINGGTDPEEPVNYASWALTEDSLIIIFDPYMIAPYAVGTQRVSIPLSELSGMLKEEYR
jgi:hypothetical protein